MAGASRDFPAAEFRREIRNVMTMAMPSSTSARPTFTWDVRKTYAPQGSSTGTPMDLTTAPATSTALPDVQALCVVELLDAAGDPIETPVGDFEPDQARLTFLDVDWALVVVDGRAFDAVLIDGTPYRWVKRLPTQGLFDVDIIQVLVSARDES